MMQGRVWISGAVSDQPGPLQRFLPLFPNGVTRKWLSETIPIGSLILDPFGSTPQTAVEAARGGYRVLVAANNPVARFVLDMAANPPAENELKAALAELSSTTKGSERLPQHISNLYLTECAQCGNPVSAESFLWERGASSPYARIYSCPQCGDSGEHPALESDAQHAQMHQKHSLTWAKALERVAPLNDPDREHAEEALDAYLPRAVYALMTLISAVDKLAPSPAATAERSAWIYRQRSMIALLLSACDRGNSLWSLAGSRSRPRQLSRPARFIEYNLWKALEESISQWAAPEPDSGGIQSETDKPVPLVIWPELPPSEGGITLYEGRIREFVDELKSEYSLQALVSAIPRPNQAYWSLSALWAGWLWGREAADSFKSVLRRRRYDWAWHTTALTSALQSIEPCLAEGTPFFSLVSEAEAGYLTALFIAAISSGFDLHSLALRSEVNQLQAQWMVTKSRTLNSMVEIPAPSLPAGQKIQETALAACLDFLEGKAEPAGILGIHTAALIGIQDLFSPGASDPGQAAEIYTLVQNNLQQIYLNRSELQRFGGSEGSLEGGKWWSGTVKDTGTEANKILPLADRVEIFVVRSFQAQAIWQYSQIDRLVCIEHSGLDTPDASLIRACVESYADEIETDVWKLRTGETAAQRRKDLSEIRTLLDQIMQSVGLSTRAPVVELPGSQYGLVYESPDGTPIYQFQIMVSAVLGSLMNNPPKAIRGAYILCPGSRAILLEYKQRNNPALNNLLQRDWKFIKFRLLRRITENMPIDLDTLEKQLGVDPLSNRDPQIQLL